MLVFKKLKTHVMTTLSINLIYFITIIVALLFFKYPGFLKFLFIMQIFLYLSFYFILLKKKINL